MIQLEIKQSYDAPSWIYVSDAASLVESAVKALEKMPKTTNQDHESELVTLARSITKLMVAFGKIAP